MAVRVFSQKGKSSTGDKVLDIGRLLLIYSFKFTSAFSHCRLVWPQRASIAEKGTFYPVTVNFDL